MPQYDNTNRGVLFKNDRKTKATDPDYKGNLNINGTEYWLSAWINETSDKRKFFKITPTPKERVRQDAAPMAGVPKEEFNDDIPF